jgi:hypothetical protein
MVAGRRLRRAQDFCAALPGSEPVEADRNGDVAALLTRHRPDLVIDAAGPFQASGYRVPQACIDARIPYLDLADGRDFVTGIGTLDEDARRAGVAIVTGASSVPALSGAVIRALGLGLDRITSVEIVLSTSNRSSLGASVVAAALSYAGKPVRVWRARHWATVWGWQSLKRVRFEVEGVRSLTRLIALADVPDHTLVPAEIAGAPGAIFRAGPEFAFQTLALWLLTWPVRWRWVRSLSPLAGLLGRLLRLTDRFGGGRSAMSIELRGLSGNGAVTRRWTLIAGADRGIEIPALAAAILADRIVDGDLPAGARHAGGLLDLEDFEPLFAELPLRHATTDQRSIPLYARVMGDRFARLPAAVRNMHMVHGSCGASGSARVVRGSSVMARLLATAMRFPPTGDHELHVAFEEQDGRERWTRSFGGYRFSSELGAEDGGLVERFGPLRFHFDLPSDSEGLAMEITRWSLFRIPLPRALAPHCPAREWQDGEDFCFDVPVALPGIGPVVHYCGRLKEPPPLPLAGGD